MRVTRPLEAPKTNALQINSLPNRSTPISAHCCSPCPKSSYAPMKNNVCTLLILIYDIMGYQHRILQSLGDGVLCTLAFVLVPHQPFCCSIRLHFNVFHFYILIFEIYDCLYICIPFCCFGREGELPGSANSGSWCRRRALRGSDLLMRIVL